MSSPSASTLLVSPAVLAARAFVLKLDMFLASLANVSTGADQKMVVGAMKVFEKWLWYKGQVVDVTWSQENKLREWCMAQYVENAGAAWLASFEANFLWTELSPDSKVTAYVKSLVQLDLARPEHTWVEAAAQSAAIMSAEQEAELLAERRVALADLSAKRMADAQSAGFLEEVGVGAASGGDAVEMGEVVAEVEAAAAEPAGGPPTATSFTDAQLRNLLVPCRDEVVLNANCQAGESVPGLKRKKTVSLTAQRDFKACTFSGRKSCEHGKVDPHVQCNFEKAVLVRHAREFVVAQQTLATTGGTTLLSTASLALPTAQESGIAVDMAAPKPATPKGKAKVVSSPCKQLASLSSDSRPTKQSRSGMASRKRTKAAPHQEETPPVAGPSQQIIPVDPIEPVLRPGNVVLSKPESPSGAEVPSEHEEEAELSDVSESLSEVPAVPLHVVQPNYAPLPIPRVDGQEFLWLGKTLDYPISALRPSSYIEAAREKAEGMAEVMRKDMRAAAAEMEGLRLQKKIMERSVNILERYQANCVEALEWREANEAYLQQPFVTLFPLLPGASLNS
ncbi:hypothetical protein C0992_006018 [Termitomyces sp. T32_za158]|nr:hypothetical protein C0992_006018 [Termitomyces sp. T32_za158]